MNGIRAKRGDVVCSVCRYKRLTFSSVATVTNLTYESPQMSRTKSEKFFKTIAPDLESTTRNARLGFASREVDWSMR